MIKVGDRVRHYEYGEGEVVTTREEVGELTVAFEKEFEVLTGSIIDATHVKNLFQLILVKNVVNVAGYFVIVVPVVANTKKRPLE